MALKTCTKCKSTKDLAGFFRDRQKKDGISSQCKECAYATRRAYAKTEAGRAAKRQSDGRRVRTDEYKRKDLARVLAYQKTSAGRLVRSRAFKKYVQTDRGRAVMAAARKRHRELYPERIAARNAVSRALKSGALKRSNCFCCGSVDVEAHHSDYSRPLEVTWLCHFHHSAIHHG